MKLSFTAFTFLCSLHLIACSTSDSTRLAKLQLAVADLVVDDHCEVPCGIYGDSLRVALIDEHIRTIEKATHQIIELSDKTPTNFNQIVRWINNKEHHAEEIQQIVAQYFMHQRVKIVDEKDAMAVDKYNTLLKHLHHIMVYSMKAKQGLDIDNIAQLKASLERFEDAYFHKH